MPLVFLRALGCLKDIFKEEDLFHVRPHNVQNFLTSLLLELRDKAVYLINLYSRAIGFSNTSAYSLDSDL